MSAAGAWLAAGTVVGAVATAGVVAVVLEVTRPEPLPTDPAVPTFVEETATAGIRHVYDGEFEFFVGGGVAAFDCDSDGRPDLYLAGGEAPAVLYRNASPVGGPFRFEDARERLPELDRVTGAYPLDIDGDGRVDLAVLRHGENVLLRGLGDCRFERANEAWGFDGGDDWTAAFSATWESEAGMPTLAFGNYLAADGRQSGECSDHALLRPSSTGRYAAPISLQPGRCTLSILFSDWGGSGRRDLRMTNDRHYYRDGEEQLWRMAAAEAPRPYRAEEGWQTMQIWGMGIASHDLTGDGRPEVFLTSQGDNKLQTLMEGAVGPHYADIAYERGATAHRPFAGDVSSPSTAWHAEFQDVNNDSLIDLFVAKGNVEAMPDYAQDDPNNLLLGRADGTFDEAAVEAGIVSFARARGAALVDLDLDGWLDLVVVNRREPVQVWRNQGVDGVAANWIAVALEQPGANRDAVGAWVEVEVDGRISRREVTVGGGHAGGRLGPHHFGLGGADRARIRVTWPDGEIGAWTELEAGEVHVVGRAASG